jgi:hypothetical protein
VPEFSEEFINGCVAGAIIVSIVVTVIWCIVQIVKKIRWWRVKLTQKDYKALKGLLKSYFDLLTHAMGNPYYGRSAKLLEDQNEVDRIQKMLP